MNSSDHILMTGGTGFVGRALLRFGLMASHNVDSWPRITVLSRSGMTFLERYPEFSEASWLQMHTGDILKPETFPNDTKFSHIFHAAADSTLGPTLTAMQRYDQIVLGTRNVLDFAVNVGAVRLAFISSGGVYGTQPLGNSHISEDCFGMPDPLDVGNAYSIAKRTAEHLCALYSDAYGFEIVIARCFAFVGQDLPLNGHFAIGNFIRDALFHKEIIVNGDGTPLRSYLAQNDLAQWLMTILYNGKSGEAYNVGSDQAVSILELANLVRDLLAPGIPVRIRGALEADHVRKCYIPDISRAKVELGLHVVTPLSDAIIRTAKMVRGNAVR
jgi:dTDP-glucose 4,6-dehydratase